MLEYLGKFLPAMPRPRGLSALPTVTNMSDFHDPYREVQVRGRVVERRPGGDCKYIDAISQKYTGKPFPFRQPEGRVALVIEIEKARFTKLPSEHTPP